MAETVTDKTMSDTTRKKKPNKDDQNNVIIKLLKNDG